MAGTHTDDATAAPPNAGGWTVVGTPRPIAPSDLPHASAAQPDHGGWQVLSPPKPAIASAAPPPKTGAKPATPAKQNNAAADNAAMKGGVPASFKPGLASGISSNDRWYDPIRRGWGDVVDAVNKGTAALGSAAAEIAWNEANPDSPLARPTPSTDAGKAAFVKKYGTTPEKKKQAEAYIKHLDATRAAGQALTKVGVGAAETIGAMAAGDVAAAAILPEKLHAAIQTAMDVGFIGQMTAGSVQAVPKAIAVGKKYGYDSPQFSSYATESGANAIFAGLGLFHLAHASSGEIDEMASDPKTKPVVEAADEQARQEFGQDFKDLPQDQKVAVAKSVATGLARSVYSGASETPGGRELIEQTAAKAGVEPDRKNPTPPEHRASAEAAVERFYDRAKQTEADVQKFMERRRPEGAAPVVSTASGVPDIEGNPLDPQAAREEEAWNVIERERAAADQTPLRGQPLAEPIPAPEPHEKVGMPPEPPGWQDRFGKYEPPPPRPRSAAQAAQSQVERAVLRAEEAARSAGYRGFRILDRRGMEKEVAPILLDLGRREVELRRSADTIEEAAPKPIDGPLDPEQAARAAADKAAADNARKMADRLRSNRDEIRDATESPNPPPAAERSLGSPRERPTALERPQGERRAPITPLATGKSTEVLLPDGTRLPAHYAIVSPEQIRPSHNPWTWQWYADYPSDAQPRERNISNRAKTLVSEIAQAPDPAQLFSTDPTAQTSPPVMLPDGVVIGGNGRTMGMIRAYESGNGEPIRQGVEARPETFGTAKGEQKPIPVIMLDRDVTSPAELRKLGYMLNKGAAGALSPAEHGNALAALLGPADMDWVAEKMEAMGPDATLRSFMSKHSEELARRLAASNVFGPGEIEAYITTQPGTHQGELNRAGKDLFEAALRGRAIGDPALVARASAEIPSVIDKLDRSLGVLNALRTRGGKWDFMPGLNEALRIHLDAYRAQDTLKDVGPGAPSQIDKWLHQESYIGGMARLGEQVQIPKIAEVLAKLLEHGSKDVRTALGAYGEEAAKVGDPNQTGFSFAAEPPEPWTVFNRTVAAASDWDGVPPVRLTAVDWVDQDNPVPAAPAVEIAEQAEAVPDPVPEPKVAAEPPKSGVEKFRDVLPESSRAAVDRWLGVRPDGTVPDKGIKRFNLAVGEYQRTGKVPNASLRDAFEHAFGPAHETPAAQIDPAESLTAAAPVAKRYGSTNSVVSGDAAAKAAQRLRNKTATQLNSGFDPEMLRDAAIVGAYHFEAGTRAFAEWGSAMLRDIGEAVRPHLVALYNRSRQALIDAADRRLQHGTLSPEERDRVGRLRREIKAIPPMSGERLWSPESGQEVRDVRTETNQPRGRADAGVQAEKSRRTAAVARNQDQGPVTRGADVPRPLRADESRPRAAEPVSGGSEALKFGRGKKTERSVKLAENKPRGVAIVPKPAWENRLSAAGLPSDIPAPTVALRQDLAEKLIFPGQREIAETALSGLDQHGGFLIASSPGSGKSYLAAAIVAQIGDGKRTLVLTKNAGLIEAEDNGLADIFQRFGVGSELLDAKQMPDKPGVYMTTYANLVAHPEIADQKWDVAVMDESGEARRWWASKTGTLAKTLGENSGKALYMSATPYHTPLEVGYMDRLGLWPEGGFDDWVQQFGVRKKGNSYSGTLNPYLMADLRLKMLGRGVFVNMDTDLEGFNAHMAMVPLSNEQNVKLRGIISGFEKAKAFYAERGDATRMRQVGGLASQYVKAWLERERLPQAIEMAKGALKQGYRAAIFAETMHGRDELYAPLARADQYLGGELAKLIPPLPDVVGELEREFGNDLANYSGPHSRKRSQALTDYLAGRKKVLFASYGAGGVGMSAHDTVGDAPRAVIYLGPPWSGIMLEQATRRFWRFGTKSDTNAIFTLSNTVNEMRLVAGKVAPRLEMLKSSVRGMEGADKILAGLKGHRGELAAWLEGQESALDLGEFRVASPDGFKNWKDLGLPSAEDAKHKGMKYRLPAVEPDAKPGTETTSETERSASVGSRDDLAHMSLKSARAHFEDQLDKAAEELSKPDEPPAPQFVPSPEDQTAVPDTESFADIRQRLRQHLQAAQERLAAPAREEGYLGGEPPETPPPVAPPPTGGSSGSGEPPEWTPVSTGPPGSGAEGPWRRFVNRKLLPLIGMAQRFSGIGDKELGHALVRMMAAPSAYGYLSRRYVAEFETMAGEGIALEKQTPEQRETTLERQWALQQLADDANRDNLYRNHRDLYDKWASDKAVQTMLRQWAIPMQEMTAMQRMLGGRILQVGPRTLDLPDGTKFDFTGGYFPRAYDAHVPGLHPPEDDTEEEPPDTGKKVGPQRPDFHQRLATAEYFFDHGVKEIGPAFGKKYTRLGIRFAENDAWHNFVTKATPISTEPGPDGSRPGLPAAISYNGEVYYRTDIARQIKEAKPDAKAQAALLDTLRVELDRPDLTVAPKPKDVKEYGVFSPGGKGRELSIKIDTLRRELSRAGLNDPAIEGAVRDLDNAAYAISLKYLAPKAAVESLDEIASGQTTQERMARWEASAPLGKALRGVSRFIQMQFIDLGGGIAHVQNLTRRITELHTAGAADPRGWLEAAKVGMRSIAGEDFEGGVWSPEFKTLLKNAGISGERERKYRAYLDANLSPLRWLHKINSEMVFGEHGFDTEARIWLTKSLKAQHPAMSDGDIAETVSRAFGRVNRARWNNVMSAVAPFMLFPGWGFAKPAFILDHPITTAAIPALLAFGINEAFNLANQNSQQNAHQTSSIVAHGRKVYPRLLFDPDARRAVKAASDVAGVLSSGRGDLAGPIHAATGEAIGETVPLISEVYDQSANLMMPYGGTITYPGDAKKQGVIFPWMSLSVEKRLLHAVFSMVPFAQEGWESMGTPSAVAMDHAAWGSYGETIAGSVVGLSNYPASRPAPIVWPAPTPYHRARVRY